MWLAGVWWEEGATFTESRARQAASESVAAGDICAVDTTTRPSNELLLSSDSSAHTINHHLLLTAATLP
jgi:hypothetical protein